MGKGLSLISLDELKSMDTTKVLIIGLDGFTWRIGKKLIQKGYMPTLSKLVKSGCHGTLKSVIPYETSPAWSSLQTGCYPEKTGVFAFHGYSRQTRHIRLNSFQEIQVPTIWELLSDAGKKVVSINMPMTSPPPQVKGVIIPGLTCPEISRETVFPPEIFDKYIKFNPDYCVVNNSTQPNLKSYVDSAAKTEQVRCELALKLMQDEDWDLFSVQIQSTDAFQHKNWWALDPAAEGFTDADYNQAAEFYQGIDSIIGKLVKAAGNSVLTVIASDHGFCSKKAEIGINTWLSQNGFLVSHSPEPEHPAKTIKEKLKRKFPPLKSLAGLYGQILKSSTSLCQREKKNQKLYSETVVRHIRETIDLDQSLAFSLGGMAGSLYLTDVNRKHEADIMINGLLEAYGPNSLEPLITSIKPLPSSLNSEGPSFSPDFMINFAPGVEARINPEGKSVIRSGVINNKQTGTHEQEGVFVLHGPGVNADSSLNADIVDIAPTILAFLSAPVPGQIDGSVLHPVFEKPLEVCYKHTDKIKKNSADYSNTAQSLVEKQLEDLGYL